VDENPTRDPNYYFYDGTVFLVGGVLFKIHASRLSVHSSVFRELSPWQNDSNNDLLTGPGSSDENPIVVHEVEVEAFRNLLVMFYGM
ncbi:hypothetical protein FRC06_002423, partial [Ceratobasidium sp. 370]